MLYLTRVTLFALISIITWSASTASAEDNLKELLRANNINTATIYKSPTCGCCNGYAAKLEEYGLKIKRVDNAGLSAIKDKFSVPTNGRSCHTVKLGEYFIEGHVPMESIANLIATKPDIDGIGLPAMPIGTPGMPGKQTQSFKVYQAKNGTSKPFMVIPPK